jgi:CRISPR-associated Csx10 family RAMP protein
MKTILNISADSPLNFRISPQRRAFETLKYIPGTSLLGAFADAHRKTRYNEEEEFSRFFLSGRIRFGNLYPANFKAKELQDEKKLPVKPLPNTARSCKRFGGFRFNAEKEDEERHGVMDYLIYWGLFALSGRKKIEIINEYKYCKYKDDYGVCGESLDAIAGFYRRGDDVTQSGIAKTKKRLLTRTGISRETGTVQEGILYNREVLNEGQNFWGTMFFAEESLYDDFVDFAKKVAEMGILRIGNNLTRGLGKPGMPDFSSCDSESYEGFKKRLSSFNQKFCAESEKYNIDLPHQFYFPITLQSDTIIVDRLLRYQTAIDKDYLSSVWHLVDASLVYQSAGQRRVMGWNALFGLPKVAQWAISMGSVFLFGYDGAVDDNFFNTLFRIEEMGVGTRRMEGFGEVTIADDFHWEVNEYESTNENSQRNSIEG